MKTAIYTAYGPLHLTDIDKPVPITVFIRLVFGDDNSGTVMKARQIVQHLLKNPKQLFLIDSLGAGLTLFFLLAILLPFSNQFGIPPSVLLALAVPVLAFVLYSAYCFLFAGTHWRSLLKVIAVANLLYCCMIAGLVVANYARLTLLGMTYFVLEIAVICALVSVELRALTPYPVNTKR